MNIGTFFSNNPFAWVIVILGALGIYRAKEELDEARGRRDAERKAEARARRVQTEVRKRNDERLEKADATRAGFRSSSADDFGGLSDAAIRRLTRGAERDSDGSG